MKILLVEDDRSLGETIQKWLEMDGYVGDWLMNGSDAKNVIIDGYDCLLLDRGLPGESGDAVLKALRQYRLAIRAVQRFHKHFNLAPYRSQSLFFCRKRKVSCKSRLPRAPHQQSTVS